MSKPRVKKTANPPEGVLAVPQNDKKVKKAPALKVPKKQKVSSDKKADTIKKTKRQIVKVKGEETVTLPPAPSLRLLEKVNLYKVWYQETLPLQVTTAARFFGYLFIVLGTLFAASSHLSNTELPPSLAALVCSAGVCEEVPDESLPVGSPQITFLNSIPKEIKADVDFNLKVENLNNYQVVLLNINTGTKLELDPVSELESGSFQYQIPTAKMTPGHYRLEAEADSDVSKYIFDGPVFSYRLEDVDLEPVDVIDSVIDLDTEAAAISEATTTASDVAATSTSLVLTDERPVSIRLEQTAEASYLVIATGDFLPKQVNVYSRVDHSPSALYLGQAHLVQNEWFFSLSAINVPQIPQQFFATFVVDDIVKKTKAVSLPLTEIKPSLFNTPEDTLIKKRKIDLTLEALGSNIADRNFYYSNNVSNLKQENELQFVSESVVGDIDTVLEAEVEILNTYFFHYAIAYLGKQSFLIDLAEQQINNYAILLAGKIAEKTNSTLTPAVETIIKARFDKLLSIIQTEEEVLISETSTLIQQDTDQDGLSDYDELTSSLTDTTSPDTDQDGVIDSIEVVLLTNPLLADGVRYPEVKQNHLTIADSEVLAITNSKKLLLETDSQLPKQTQYIIEGKGIPNTFVYLLDEANNTIGLIKTNALGDFFYTIDTPSSNEDASILAALISPDGALLVVSPEYQYTKQPNQLMAATSQMLLDVENLTARFTSFNVLTGSIGLVALGFVLLFLAQGLRNRRRTIAFKDLNFATKQ